MIPWWWLPALGAANWGIGFLTGRWTERSRLRVLRLAGSNLQVLCDGGCDTAFVVEVVRRPT
jgi:hypothetical protein